jgi:hypothetical protein
MATEDKLDQGQRIRLEGLALALAYSPPETPAGEIIVKAESFGNFIEKGVTNDR